jgi:hypothetical protein
VLRNLYVSGSAHDVDDGGLPNVWVPRDFETVML